MSAPCDWFSRPIIALDRFNASFLEERSQALNKFLSAVVANPRLRAAPELSAFLIKDPHRHALTVDGQPSTSPSDKGGVVDHYLVDNPLTSAIENTLMHAWTGDRKSQPTFETQMEQDYYNIQKIAKRWDVAPSKLPFQKFVVLSLGTTSAGTPLGRPLVAHSDREDVLCEPLLRFDGEKGGGRAAGRVLHYCRGGAERHV